MIRELIREIYNGHRVLTGDGAILVLYIASIIVMLFAEPSKGRKTAPAVLSVAATIGCAFARFFKAVRSAKGLSRPVRYAAFAFALCLGILACAVSGRMVFSRELSVVSGNDLHIPQSILGSMDAILADADDPKVLTMPGWSLYFESYSSAFTLLYEDPEGDDLSGFDEDAAAVYTELTKKVPDMKKVARTARGSGCTYVVLSKDMWPEKPITRYGYDVLYEDDECCVYKEVSSP